ncbi:STAS-like domain-containing protein [uncultured Chitinophaga sp.]|uniref:STAS-like domain-containing protein n=1 Tax=uncultured Chitinophaga sp. TaxID=339340 RepID=UPI0025FD2CA7|nr:STAS-like domain-containing protein [uncultured Chitinophaga sp.]
MYTLKIADSFTPFPGLRHCNISDNSGEEFYHKVLNPAFAQQVRAEQPITIDIDDSQGYASSFLDEAFGNMVYDFGLETVRRYVTITSEEEPHWKEMIEEGTYLQWEERRKQGKAPKVTEQHPAWYRIANGELKLAVWEN